MHLKFLVGDVERRHSIHEELDSLALLQPREEGQTPDRLLLPRHLRVQEDCL